MDNINPIFIKEYYNDRLNFIEHFNYCMIKMMKDEIITKFSLKKYVSKVSFVPLNIKNDEFYVTLGKHSFGRRKDQFNFIGGGTRCSEDDWDFKKESEKMNIVASGLFDEVYEEFGIMLNWEYFKESLIDVRRCGSFLLFYVNIVNINPEKWKNMQDDRVKIKNLSVKFTEILEIKDYSLKFIKSEYERLKDPENNKIRFYVENENIEVSRYVISMNRHMFEMFDKIKKNPDRFNINIDKFKDIPLKCIYSKTYQKV